MPVRGHGSSDGDSRLREERDNRLNCRQGRGRLHRELLLLSSQLLLLSYLLLQLVLLLLQLLL